MLPTLLSTMSLENVNVKTLTTPRWIPVQEYVAVRTLTTPKWAPTASAIALTLTLISTLQEFANAKTNGRPSTPQTAYVFALILTPTF